MLASSLCIFHSDGFFTARGKSVEGDLPQPVDGEARCWIVAADVDMEPIPYRSRADLEHVIRSEFHVAGQGYLPVGEYVEYYTRTAKDYEGVVSELKKQINEAAARGVGLDRVWGEAA